MAVIAYPWADLTTGAYLYRMPGWDAPAQVTVEQGQGDFAGELLVRNSPKFIPERLTNIPVAATFEPLHATGEACA